MSTSAGKTEHLFYRTPPNGCLLKFGRLVYIKVDWLGVIFVKLTFEKPKNEVYIFNRATFSGFAMREFLTLWCREGPYDPSNSFVLWLANPALFKYTLGLLHTARLATFISGPYEINSECCRFKMASVV